MREIEFKKVDNIVDHLSVFVNGEKHVMSNQSLTVQAADDKPLEVKVQFGGHVSDVVQFELQNNMILEISKNKRRLKQYWTWLLIGSFWASFTGAFLAKSVFLYILGILIILGLIVLAIYLARNSKNIYTVREINNENTV